MYGLKSAKPKRACLYKIVEKCLKALERVLAQEHTCSFSRTHLYNHNIPFNSSTSVRKKTVSVFSLVTCDHNVTLQ